MKKRGTNLKNSNKIGKIGEDIACEYLIKEGYIILDRNFRTKFGEIDIIGKKQDIIIFFEVKTRSNIQYGYPYEYVDYKKQRKIINTAHSYIKYKNIKDMQYRFDIIEVYQQKETRINHIENAFWLNS